MLWKRLALITLILFLTYKAFNVGYTFPSVGWVGGFIGYTFFDPIVWLLIIPVAYYSRRDGSLWSGRTMCAVCKVNAADSKDGSMCTDCYAKAEAELEAARLRR